MTMPPAIAERLAELRRQAAEHQKAIVAIHHDSRITNAALAEIEFAIAAYAADAGPAAEPTLLMRHEFGQAPGSGEAVAQGTGISATPTAPEAGSAPVTPAAAKKPRAPKRDIRAMVLDGIVRWPAQSMFDLAANLGVPLKAVEKAVEYWQREARVTLSGGLIRLAELVAPIEVGWQDDAKGSGDLPPATPAQQRDRLTKFLANSPDSTMAEIVAYGIPAAAVYLAERDGVVRMVDPGLYAMAATPEAERNAAE
jgi:hypothetical protein